MKQSDSIAKLSLALSKAQKEFTGAVKDSANPFYNSKYADLESVWGAIKEPLAKNELSILQPTGMHNDIFGVYTILAHSSGEYITGFTPVRAKDQSAQAMGSGISYARRYALAAMTGVYQVDDDGNAADGLKDADKKDGEPKQEPQSPPPETSQNKPESKTKPKDSPKAPPPPKNKPSDKLGISEAQQKRLWAIGVTGAGYEWPYLCRLIGERYGVKDFTQFKQSDYQDFCTWLETNPKTQEEIPF